MKKLIITTLLIIAGLSSYSQRLDSLNLKYRSVKDTIPATIIVYGKDGFLQKKDGKVIRQISVFEIKSLQPEVTSTLYFLNDWTAIKQEDVYEARPKNK